MKVRFRPEAALELREARDWYAAREEQLGLQFVAAIDAVVNRIVLRPLAFPALVRPAVFGVPSSGASHSSCCSGS